MAKWYRKITDDLTNLPDCIDYFEEQVDEAKYDISLKGNIEKNLANLPGITEHRFGQLQELEAILEYLNTHLKKRRSESFRKYLESYNRALSSRDADRYVDGDQDIFDLSVLINEVAMVRNKFLGIMKAIDSKNFMIGHITRLRTAGMEDSEITIG